MDKGLVYLFVAYSLIWIVIFLYLVNLSRQNKKLHKEINLLKGE